MKIELTGWVKGLQKISLTKLIRECAGYGLAAGKACVDDLLEGKTVVIEMPDAVAPRFMEEATMLGAKCAPK